MVLALYMFMTYSSYECVRRCLELANKLKDLSESDKYISNDTGCMVLLGIIRDCAYRIEERAEYEKKIHENMGIRDYERS